MCGEKLNSVENYVLTSIVTHTFYRSAICHFADLRKNKLLIWINMISHATMVIQSISSRSINQVTSFAWMEPSLKTHHITSSMEKTASPFLLPSWPASTAKKALRAYAPSFPNTPQAKRVPSSIAPCSRPWSIVLSWVLTSIHLSGNPSIRSM